MSLKEFYEEIGGNYDEAFSRLMDDNAIEKVLLMFLKDDNYNQFMVNMKNGNLRKAFYNIHTLKGVCLNLALTKLYNIVDVITEVLRKSQKFPEEGQISRLKLEYEKVICSINKIMSE